MKSFNFKNFEDNLNDTKEYFKNNGYIIINNILKSSTD